MTELLLIQGRSDEGVSLSHREATEALPYTPPCESCAAAYRSTISLVCDKTWLMLFLYII